MNEYRMDAALHSLALQRPKAPSELVESMVRRVDALSRKREQLKAGDAGNVGRKTQVLPGEAGLRRPDKHKKTL